MKSHAILIVGICLVILANLANGFVTTPKLCQTTRQKTTTKANRIVPTLITSRRSESLTRIGYNNDDMVNTAVFVAGIIPFGWATVEFWRRIAVGQPFGTGQDSVLIAPPSDDVDHKSTITTIGEDGRPQSSRGRRVLGRGALIAAYILFTLAAAAIGLVLYSVLTSPPAPTEFIPMEQTTLFI